MEFPKLIEFPSKRNSTTTKIKKEKWKSKMRKMHELFNVWMMNSVFYIDLELIIHTIKLLLKKFLT